MLENYVRHVLEPQQDLLRLAMQEYEQSLGESDLRLAA